uniref:Uncharacterized protein n=1 Tax=Anguilla anguilla TaxID=7936 RepID=A0A0E9TXQ9_ANGAN
MDGNLSELLTRLVTLVSG